MTKDKKRKAKEKTEKSPKPAGFPFGDKTFYTLFLLVIILALFLRLNHLSSDPALNLSWSMGPFTDEGHVVSDARDKLFFGGWNLDDFFRMGVSGLVTVLTFIVFKLFGSGFAQARLVPILFSLLSILFVFIVLKKEHNSKFAFLGSFFLAFCYVYLMHNRLALEETTLIFFLVLSIFFWQKGEEKLLFYGCSGLSLGCATLFVKPLGLFSGLVLIIILDFFRRKSGSFFKNIKLVKIKPLFYFVLGLFLVLIVWLVLIFAPYREVVIKILTGTSAGRPENIFEYIKNFLNLGTNDRLFNRMPLIFFLSFCYFLYWFKNLKQNLKNSSSIEFISVLWLFLGMLFLSITNYHPIRYQMILIPPLCLLAGLALGKLSGMEFFKTKGRLTLFTLIIWWVILFTFSYNLLRLISVYQAMVFKSIILASLILLLLFLFYSLKPFRKGVKIGVRLRALSVFLLLILFFLIQLNQYSSWASNTQNTLTHISRDLRSLPSGSVIAGPWAGTVCMENSHRAIIVQNWANTENLIERFGVTHLVVFLIGGRVSWEGEFFRKNYPQATEGATLTNQYKLPKGMLLIYKI
ncbi:MAG: hypothetical protein AMJ90_04550 [candidate division Zixibacteria bacterium SM23_73_2]|nr:MAG: hypothetical protein AMJ90_04550 [candidate division Zixibacteria bacterium SM23_73_2]